MLPVFTKTCTSFLIFNAMTHCCMSNKYTKCCNMLYEIWLGKSLHCIYNPFTLHVHHRQVPWVYKRRTYTCDFSVSIIPWQNDKMSFYSEGLNPWTIMLTGWQPAQYFCIACQFPKLWTIRMLTPAISLTWVLFLHIAVSALNDSRTIGHQNFRNYFCIHWTYTAMLRIQMSTKYILMGIVWPCLWGIGHCR